jgi:hypothetical protein
MSSINEIDGTLATRGSITSGSDDDDNEIVWESVKAGDVSVSITLSQSTADEEVQLRS